MQTEQITTQESTGTAGLWFGILAGPIGWSIQFTADYLTGEWLSCTRGFRMRGVIFGVSTTTWIVLTNAFFVAVIVVALVTSIRRFQQLRADDPTTGKRAGFMAFVGIVNSIVFLVPVVMGFVPALTFSRCGVSP
jgi:hypothetical protein